MSRTMADIVENPLDPYKEYEANCYVGAIAPDEENAREAVRIAFHGEPGPLVHMEPPEDPEEQPTYIFRFLADTSEQEEGDWLTDLYILPHLTDMPCEIA